MLINGFSLALVLSCRAQESFSFCTAVNPVMSLTKYCWLCLFLVHYSATHFPAYLRGIKSTAFCISFFFFFLSMSQTWGAASHVCGNDFLSLSCAGPDPRRSARHRGLQARRPRADVHLRQLREEDVCRSLSPVRRRAHGCPRAPRCQRTPRPPCKLLNFNLKHSPNSHRTLC